MLWCYTLMVRCNSNSLSFHTYSQRCYIKLRIHLRTLCSQTRLQTCSENLIFHELPANYGKMMNQLRQQFRENCWRDRKIFPRTWKRTKIQTNTLPIEPRTSFAFIEKTDWRWFATNCSRTFCEPRTHCTDIVFANKMFASVYTALHVCTHLYSLPFHTCLRRHYITFLHTPLEGFSLSRKKRCFGT